VTNRLALVLCLAALWLPLAAAAEDELLIHSDLPFTPKEGQSISPFQCGGSDGIASCSVFAMGNWRLHRLPCDIDCDEWINLHNAGIFHPVYGFHRSWKKDDTGADTDLAFIIRLTREKEPVELYAIEIGLRPGSRYLLVARRPGTKGLVKNLDVLDARCEGDGTNWRRPPEPIDVFLTDYCAVATIDALERMARAALDRPRYATLDWVDEPKE
jgi:hypothetical protein